MAIEFGVEDVLKAHAFALESLAGYLVVSGKVTPAHMTGLIEITSAKLEKEGQTKASEYLRTMWANGLNGEWEKAGRAAGNIK